MKGKFVLVPYDTYKGSLKHKSTPEIIKKPTPVEALNEVSINNKVETHDSQRAIETEPTDTITKTEQKDITAIEGPSDLSKPETNTELSNDKIKDKEAFEDSSGLEIFVKPKVKSHGKSTRKKEGSILWLSG